MALVGKALAYVQIMFKTCLLKSDVSACKMEKWKPSSRSLPLKKRCFVDISRGEPLGLPPQVTPKGTRRWLGIYFPVGFVYR